MKRYQEIYASWIAEDLEHIYKLKDEMDTWTRAYESKVFDLNWPSSIKKVLVLIRDEIKENLDQTEYFLKRIKEIQQEEYDKISLAQLNKDQGNVGVAGGVSGDPNKVSSGTEQQIVGTSPKETDNHRGSDQSGEISDSSPVSV